ncbi:hypothetical protein EVAR_68278_1 [Eumeta japonica]|uniref:Uncharacterized protein n=1 Tax=Eumeta variegata TaxID=151549 RepID=A0A4C1ZX81_EUMVA|nr:hypothetical protein EVAR_68278_1 [Eumeta japonica]
MRICYVGGNITEQLHVLLTLRFAPHLICIPRAKYEMHGVNTKKGFRNGSHGILKVAIADVESSFTGRSEAAAAARSLTRPVSAEDNPHSAR